MNRRAFITVLSLPAFIYGCATTGHRPVDLKPTDDYWTGRLSLKTQQASNTLSGRFELEGSAQAGKLNLMTPIGTQVLQAQWSQDSGVTLKTSNQVKTYPDMETLTNEALGEPLPIQALFDWLRAQPMIQLEHRLTEIGFTQLGWSVDTREYASKKITMQRVDAANLSADSPSKAVTLKVVLDQ